MRTRNIRVFFRLTESEKEHLDNLVSKSGLSREKFIRRMLKGYVLREKPDERFYKLMREFSHLSNLLNQLTAKAHTLGFVDTPQLKQTLNKISKLEQEIRSKFLLPEKVE